MDDVFVYVLMMILIYFILFFYKRKNLDSIIYVFSHPRILLGLNVFFSFDVFSLGFSLDRINLYTSKIIGLVLILWDISVCLGILFS